MATEISAPGTQRAIGNEEYSLYSSLSEEELVQMAIEQSLADKTRGPTTTEASLSARANRQPAHFYPWTRSTAPPESGSAHLGLFQGVMQKYNRNKASQLAPVDPVLKAIKEDDEEALKAMMKAGRNLAEANKEGWLPLHEAAYYGQLSCLKALHRAYPATIDQRTLQEETALYLATCRGHLDCLQSLLQAGAEPDISNKSRETPLYKACERKNVEAVRILVQYNADTNHRCNRGWTALHESVSRNDLEVMEILVSSGAKVESKNAYGITPLFVAAQSGQLEALRFLAKHGADINTQASDSASALFEACKNEHQLVVEFLLSQGADANKANKDGMLPLHVASKKGNYSPLLVAIRHGSLRIMQLLLDHGANIDAYIATHPTSFPATIMFSMKYLSLLKFLMDLGCDGEPCFSCTYGNGPHPPAPPPSSRFNDVPACDKAPCVVQFCEILSAPEVSRWAGPIIDVLLDYVGNVQLCARLKEHIDSYEDWAVIKEKAEPPRPLAHLCRLQVRKAIGKYRLKLLDTLPLPGRLIRYLKYENTQ
ncbi:Ankyrin repeat and SOCS box protein 2 [Myotis brandtii]|uniref:Ankyrin repeat and SOCS box protein 2 n=1 Tax=Myotis brandtii TaxID=109478 RepID=S7NCV8_MYOBR|nr:Ankyrin repeat and SOCS box protein 2 [Myotis brandtii]